MYAYFTLSSSQYLLITASFNLPVLHVCLDVISDMIYVSHFLDIVLIEILNDVHVDPLIHVQSVDDQLLELIS